MKDPQMNTSWCVHPQKLLTCHSTKSLTFPLLQNVAFLSFIGFTIFEAIFALIVKSESMLADAEAMAVDAMTYLFNLCAERIKKAPYTESELRMPADVREHRRKMKRLYLELFPPLISVTTLLAVTVLTLRDSLHTLFGEDNEEESSVTEDEKAGVMLFFSALNLALDVMNVMCFARADQAFGLSVMKSQEEFRKSLQSTRSEDLALLENARMRISYDEEGDGIEVKEWNASRSRSIGEDSEDSYALVNLNMCSAWTHVCADTMRSIAVLVAAAIAFLFKSVSADAADASSSSGGIFHYLDQPLALVARLVSDGDGDIALVETASASH